MTSQNADDKQPWSAQTPSGISITELPPLDFEIIIKVKVGR